MIAEWGAQLPAILATAALLILPGLPAVVLLRISWVLRLGLAIAVSLGIVAGAAIVAPLVGLSWSLIPVLLVAAVVAALAGVLIWLGRRRDRRVAPRTRPQTWFALGLAALGWFVILIVGIGADHPSQLYDGIFHLNAVEFIEKTGSASPFDMTMVVPGSSSSFYPTLWHALVSLIVPVSGTIVSATNVVTVVAIAVIWPVALAALTGVLFPRHPAATTWAPLVAFGFSVFPLGFLNWGVLYPNLLGTLLLPLLLASVLLASRRAGSWSLQVLLILVALAAAGATAMGHPSALLAGVALLVPFALWRAWETAKASALPIRVLLAVACSLGLIVLGVTWVSANVTTNEWLPSQTMAQALGEVALLSPVGRTAGLLLGPLAAIGIWQVVRDRMWWVLGSYAVAIGFYLMSAWFPILSIRSLFVGVWYDDTTRVGALLAILGLPFAGLGAAILVGWLRRLWAATSRRGGVIALIVVVALAAVSHVIMIRTDVAQLRNVSFQFTDDSQGLSVDEAALFERVSEILPPDSLVIGDPLTAAGLLYAYTGHDVVFPHIRGSYGPDAETLAKEFVTGSEEVCAAVNRLGITHALDFGDRELFENHYTTFDGLHGLSRSPILTEVERIGDAALYEVSGCR